MPYEDLNLADQIRPFVCLPVHTVYAILELYKIDLMLPLQYFSKLHRIYYVGTDIHLKVLYIIWSVAVFVVVFFYCLLLIISLLNFLTYIYFDVCYSKILNI